MRCRRSGAEKDGTAKIVAREASAHGLNNQRNGAPSREAVKAYPPTVAKSSFPAIKALLAIVGGM